jgi:hypothetical protein
VVFYVKMLPILAEKNPKKKEDMIAERNPVDFFG